VTWLAASAGPDAAWLAERVTWWRVREAALVLRAPFDIEPPDLVLSAEEHQQANAWLPLRPLVEDVGDALLAWFDSALASLGGLDLATTDLGGWRSWLDARARLTVVRRFTFPSELLAALADASLAEALLFELAAPPSMGTELGRYPERLGDLVRLRPAGDVRAWDVGCATGEGTWELALALAPAEERRRVEVVGTTPCPLQRLMAERRARPHDPARGARLDAFVRAGPHDRCDVRFARHDVLRDEPPGTFDVIACHGLLGEAIDDEADIAHVVTALAAALTSGGLLSVTDRFRADRAARAAALVSAAARAAGLTAVGPGLFRST
jgi:hypothetical protein